MNDDLTPIEEQALDALLVETLAGAGPPDLSGQILDRLRETPSNVGSIVPAEQPKRESAVVSITQTYRDRRDGRCHACRIDVGCDLAAIGSSTSWPFAIHRCRAECFKHPG